MKQMYLTPQVQVLSLLQHTELHCFSTSYLRVYNTLLIMHERERCFVILSFLIDSFLILYLHLYWMGAGEEIVTKTEVLNAIFSSIFNRNTGDLQGNRLPELVDRGRKQNRTPFQEKVVNDLLCQLDTHKSVGLAGSLEGTEGAVRRSHQAALHHLSSVLAD